MAKLIKRAIGAYGYTTKVSGVVIIDGVIRNFVVREVRDGDTTKLVVVHPTRFSTAPLVGYSPLLPHYTRHAMDTLRLASGSPAYENRSLAVLLKAARRKQGNDRGTKFANPRDLFQHSKHMLTVGDKPASAYEVRKFLARLASDIAGLPAQG